MRLVKQDGACAGFEVRDRWGNVVNKHSGLLGSGTLVVGSNPTLAVFVQSWPLGFVDQQGRVRTFAGRDEDPDGIVFFKAGAVSKRFGLNRLLHRRALVQVTAGHVRWVRSMRLVGGDAIGLETTSLRSVIVGLDGALRSEADATDWRECPSIAYGRVKAMDRGAEMSVVMTAKGVPAGSVMLNAVPRNWNGTSRTLCLEPAGARFAVIRELTELAFNHSVP